MNAHDRAVYHLHLAVVRIDNSSPAARSTEYKAQAVRLLNVLCRAVRSAEEERDLQRWRTSDRGISLMEVLPVQSLSARHLQVPSKYSPSRFALPCGATLLKDDQATKCKLLLAVGLEYLPFYLLRYY